MTDQTTLKVVLVGGSGFLGRRLRSQLAERGHEVVVVGRSPSANHEGWRHVQWDAKTLGDWVGEIDHADVLVHLAGKRVDCRPTRSNIDELIASREDTVRLVGAALEHLEQPPRRWVQLSSLGVFGDPGDEIITEQSTPSETEPRQQVEVCRRWEAAFHDASSGLAETVLLRPAISIGGADDPTTRQLMQLARFGLAGPVGGGEQWVSWIGAQDIADLLVRSVIDPRMLGLYHLTAPNPVPNSELMAAYRDAVGRSFGLATPALIAKFGAWILGSDPALALTGRRCVPARLLDEGYEFTATSLHHCVADAVAAAT